MDTFQYQKPILLMVSVSRILMSIPVLNRPNIKCET